MLISIFISSKCYTNNVTCKMKILIKAKDGNTFFCVYPFCRVAEVPNEIHPLSVTIGKGARGLAPSFCLTLLLGHENLFSSYF